MLLDKGKAKHRLKTYIANKENLSHDETLLFDSTTLETITTAPLLKPFSLEHKERLIEFHEAAFRSSLYRTERIRGCIYLPYDDRWLWLFCSRALHYSQSWPDALVSTPRLPFFVSQTVEATERTRNKDEEEGGSHRSERVNRGMCLFSLQIYA